MGGFVAFDLEISTDIPEGTDDWKNLRPVGISCAATLTDAGELRLWHGTEQPDGRLADRMTPAECQALAMYLVDSAAWNVPILTFNGLGFDLDILQEECGPGPVRDFCHMMAYYDHIDIAFQMLCELGYMAGLDAAAKGMGLAGKPEGMHGDLAPRMWAQGRAQQDRVLEYVAQDVRTTADLYRAVCRQRELRWTSRSGNSRRWPLTLHGDRLLTVRECLALPEPDTSWMSAPRPRSCFVGWLTEWEGLVT